LGRGRGVAGRGAGGADGDAAGTIAEVVGDLDLDLVLRVETKTSAPMSRRLRRWRAGLMGTEAKIGNRSSEIGGSMLRA
jgi:hypothetical protein